MKPGATIFGLLVSSIVNTTHSPRIWCQSEEGGKVAWHRNGSCAELCQGLRVYIDQMNVVGSEDVCAMYIISTSLIVKITFIKRLPTYNLFCIFHRVFPLVLILVISKTNYLNIKKERCGAFTRSRWPWGS